MYAIRSYYEAQGTVHEWLEDALLPNTDLIDQATFSPDGVSATTFNVENGAYFQAGCCRPFFIWQV